MIIFYSKQKDYHIISVYRNYKSESCPEVVFVETATPQSMLPATSGYEDLQCQVLPDLKFRLEMDLDYPELWFRNHKGLA